MTWNERVQEDLAVMRRLAEQGGQVTMPGGPYYILWGVLTGIGFAVNYAIGTGEVAAPGWTIGASWGVIMSVGWAISTVMGKRESTNPDAARLTNRIVSSVWSVTGFGAGVFFVATWASGHGEYNTIPIFISFSVGAAFAIIGLLCRMNWMLIPAGGWYVLAVAEIVFRFTALTLPIFAVTFVALMVGTGLKLIAMERGLNA